MHGPIEQCQEPEKRTSKKKNTHPLDVDKLNLNIY